MADLELGISQVTKSSNVSINDNSFLDFLNLPSQSSSGQKKLISYEYPEPSFEF